MELRTDDAVILWLKGIDSEVKYWRKVFENEVGLASDDQKKEWTRVVPRVLKYHSLVSAGDKVLDVGSGPNTVLGNILPDGGMVELTATDPLSPIYNALHDMYGTKPVVRTQFSIGENLSSTFKKNTYSLVHARNCLDHSLNPVDVIWQMLHVCKVGGIIVLHHAENEAEWTSYRGLHQWNFQNENGDLKLWNHKKSIFVSQELGRLAEVKCETADYDSRRWAIAYIKKTSDIDIELPKNLCYEEIIHKVLYGSLMERENYEAFKCTEYNRYLFLNKFNFPFSKTITNKLSKILRKFHVI